MYSNIAQKFGIVCSCSMDLKQQIILYYSLLKFCHLLAIQMLYWWAYFSTTNGK